MAQKSDIGFQNTLGGSGVPGRFHSLQDHHVLTVSDGLRLARAAPQNSLGDSGTCPCGTAFYLGDHLQSWLSKAIRAAVNTYIASWVGPETSKPASGVFHSQPLECNITCQKCGSTLAVVLQGSYSMSPPAAAVTISLSTPQKTILYPSSETSEATFKRLHDNHLT